MSAFALHDITTRTPISCTLRHFTQLVAPLSARLQPLAHEALCIFLHYLPRLLALLRHFSSARVRISLQLIYGVRSLRRAQQRLSHSSTHTSLKSVLLLLPIFIYLLLLSFHTFFLLLLPLVNR